MVLFVGLVERAFSGRSAFQEIDIAAVFGGVAKWSTKVQAADEIPEVVASAFRLAVSGRPGPVVVGLPADLLDETTTIDDAPPCRITETAPAAADVEALQALLVRATAPLVLVGGTRWDADSRAALHVFAERFELPVATSYRRASLFNPLHRCYAGDLGLGVNPQLLARAEAADLVVVAGARLSEITTQGYRLFRPSDRRGRLVHVHPATEILAGFFRPDLAIHASPIAFASALGDLTPPEIIPWRDQTRLAHGDYLGWSQGPLGQPGPVNLAALMTWLSETLPTDAILCNGAGNYASWIHRFYRFRGLSSQIAPTAAFMGYGAPAAVAMKTIHPARTVVSINGDGDFLMNGQEFATAVQYGLPIVFVIFDNGMYGTIRMHQERRFPGRPIATELRNPDFAAYGRAFGGWGALVERTEDFAPGLPGGAGKRSAGHRPCALLIPTA